MLLGWVKGVQSNVMCPCNQQGGFFTRSTMEAVRHAISESQSFVASSSFDPWEDLLRCDLKSFVERYAEASRPFCPTRKRIPISTCITPIDKVDNWTSCVVDSSKKRQSGVRVKNNDTLANFWRKRGNPKKKGFETPEVRISTRFRIRW